MQTEIVTFTCIALVFAFALWLVWRQRNEALRRAEQAEAIVVDLLLALHETTLALEPLVHGRVASTVAGGTSPTPSCELWLPDRAG